MMTKAKIGAAVLGGYVLGRRKKARLALGLGALLAGARVKPKQLADALTSSPLLSGVSEQVRGELVNAGKEAATSVLTTRANSLADSLHERTRGLREKSRADDEAEERERHEEHEGHEEERGHKEREEREEEEHEEAASSPARSVSRAARAPARKAGEAARKTADRPRRDKASTGRPRSSSGASGGRSRRPDDG
ncbi:hypothetical protein F7Q99_31770 [Streptomyces kaniharaensis]|uniref:DNA primase n=1 Tax=Streptomyces kaniharaensis TaxID=212423 RepID=A0A6N7L3D0_9ACTN|nr:hypothetical protein [Streptomyces kaniharaensis]MQS16644.1 hypothetical protein [Streptomyces kaniharaensis]